jgi:hypothetical protein
MSFLSILNKVIFDRTKTMQNKVTSRKVLHMNDLSSLPKSLLDLFIDEDDLFIIKVAIAYHSNYLYICGMGDYIKTDKVIYWNQDKKPTPYYLSQGISSLKEHLHLDDRLVFLNTLSSNTVTKEKIEHIILGIELSQELERHHCILPPKVLVGPDDTGLLKRIDIYKDTYTFRLKLTVGDFPGEISVSENTIIITTKDKDKGVVISLIEDNIDSDEIAWNTHNSFGHYSRTIIYEHDNTVDIIYVFVRHNCDIMNIDYETIYINNLKE